MSSWAWRTLLERRCAMQLQMQMCDEIFNTQDLPEPILVPRKTRKARVKPQVDQLDFFSFLFGDESKLPPTAEWEDSELLCLSDWIVERSLEMIRNKEASSASFAEEIAWFYNDDEHPFSIKNCCLSAGLDLESLRHGLDAALEEEKRKIIRLIDNGKYDSRPNKALVERSVAM